MAAAMRIINKDLGPRILEAAGWQRAIYGFNLLSRACFTVAHSHVDFALEF
jgi:hypothetical protein